MPTERFQPCKEQDQHLDQTNRDASPSKTCDFWRRQCQRYDNQQQEVQLHDNQPQEVWQQREGKALALVEEKDTLNGVVIGENGKPIEKQIVLSDDYGKDNPGLAGGAGDLSKIDQSICNNLEAMLNATDAVLDVADKFTMDPASKLVIGILKAAMQKRRDDKLDEALAAISGKLDDLLLGYYHTASLHL